MYHDEFFCGAYDTVLCRPRCQRVIAGLRSAQGRERSGKINNLDGGLLLLFPSCYYVYFRMVDDFGRGMA